MWLLLFSLVVVDIFNQVLVLFLLNISYNIIYSENAMPFRLKCLPSEIDVRLVGLVYNSNVQMNFIVGNAQQTTTHFLHLPHTSVVVIYK